MKDEYQTILVSSEGFFRDRGSKFVAIAQPLQSIDQISDHLTACKKAHPKARHHCYAYRFGADGAQFRANDDGEPSGTAGRPILGQLDSFGVTNLIIIVTRYFGGTKLGTSGLINAYRAAAREALNNANIVQQTVQAYYRIEFEYSKMSDVMSAVKKSNFDILKQHFETTAHLDIAIKAGIADEQLHLLGASIAGKIPEMYKAKTDQIDWKFVEQGIY